MADWDFPLIGLTTETANPLIGGRVEVDSIVEDGWREVALIYRAFPHPGYKFSHWDFSFGDGGIDAGGLLALPNGSTQESVTITNPWVKESDGYEQGRLYATANFEQEEQEHTGEILYSPSNGGRIISKGSPLYL